MTRQQDETKRSEYSRKLSNAAGRKSRWRTSLLTKVWFPWPSSQPWKEIKTILKPPAMYAQIRKCVAKLFFFLMVNLRYLPTISFLVGSISLVQCTSDRTRSKLTRFWGGYWFASTLFQLKHVGSRPCVASSSLEMLSWRHSTFSWMLVGLTHMTLRKNAPYSKIKLAKQCRGNFF